MAARLEPAPIAPSPSLVDLRHLRSEDLGLLLDEEVEAWRQLLDWDFGKAALWKISDSIPVPSMQFSEGSCILFP